jgi:selenocysteine lyase/cysteine desulfurase
VFRSRKLGFGLDCVYIETELVKDPTDGVVRISLVHYNTIEEAEKLINCLKKVVA